MNKDFTFTTMQILYKIANWELEPLTLSELNFLLKHFIPNTPVGNWASGSPDIESYILEILSDMPEAYPIIHLPMRD